MSTKPVVGRGWLRNWLLLRRLTDRMRSQGPHEGERAIYGIGKSPDHTMQCWAGIVHMKYVGPSLAKDTRLYLELAILFSGGVFFAEKKTACLLGSHSNPS